jgi:hypothetical protein
VEKDREGKRTRRTVGWDKEKDNCRQRARKEKERQGRKDSSLGKRGKDGRT